MIFKNLLFSVAVLTLCLIATEASSQSKRRSAAQLLAQLPRNPKVTSCPAPWIQALLLPCRCNVAVPNQLLCTGRSVIDGYLELMDYRLRYTMRYQEVLHQTAKRRQLLASLRQFDTLLLADTSLTQLDTPVFRFFPLKNVILDSDRFLRQVHLVDTFGRRKEQQSIVELNNLYLVNMANVNIDE